MNCEDEGRRDNDDAASEKAARRLLNPLPFLLLDDAESAAAREAGTIRCSVNTVKLSCIRGTIASCRLALEWRAF
jgi:hypothetical protein